MSTLPEITQALCLAIARGEHDRLRSLALQAASKMGGTRGQSVQRAFDGTALPLIQPAMMQHLAAHSGPQPALKHWQRVELERSPYVPDSARRALESWLEEVRYSAQLAAVGERTRPLLLVGPTRCGKTSSAHAFAKQLSLPLFRLGLNEVLGSFMGETSAKLAAALKEMTQPAVWLVDELDAVAMNRQYDGKADNERAHAVGFLLTALDGLPAGTLLVATTNMSSAIDSAVRARFQEVTWPDWETVDQSAFVASHGGDTGRYYGSYAHAAEQSRQHRVAAIIARAKLEAAE